MTHRLKAVLLLLVVAGAGLSTRAEGQTFKKEYRMTVTVGPGYYWGQGAARFADLVRQKTGGRINIKPYYGSALLKGAQLQSPQMVARGVIDCAFESTINCSSVIPEMNVFSLPFFLDSFVDLDRLEQGQTGRSLLAAMEAKGLVGLAWAENGFRQLTTARGPVRRPADLKGMRVRVVGSPIFVDTFRQLGADAVNMNWGDAQNAFQQGVVDGQENPVGVLLPVQIWQYHRHATFWNYVADPLIVYWGKTEWERFPAEVQTAIRQAAEEAAQFEKALARAGLDDGAALTTLTREFGHTIKVPDPVAFLTGKGMTVTVLTPEERAAFRTATRPVYDKWVPVIGQAVYQAALTDLGR